MRIAYSFEPEGGAYEKAEALCEKALALDPSSPQGRFLRGRLLWSPRGGFDHGGALRELTAALVACPGLGEAHHWLGKVLSHVGLLDEAVGELEEAFRLSIPRARVPTLGSAATYRAGIRKLWTSPRRSCRRTKYQWALRQIALCQLQLGQVSEAEDTVEAASLQSPDDVLWYPIRGLVAASRGNDSLAREQVRLTTANEKAFGHYHHAQYDVACIYALLGERDHSLDWLTQAARNGFPCHPFFRRDSFLESIRGNAGFDRLMGNIEIECRGYWRLFAELQT